MKNAIHQLERNEWLLQSVKYLGIKIDQNLNWKDYINDIVVKLNRANALLIKIRNFVNMTILKTLNLLCNI